jgi:uncharacterized protein
MELAMMGNGSTSMQKRFWTALIVLFPVYLMAQQYSPAPPRPPSVQANGDAVIQVKPDLAKLTIGVVTQAPSAQGAAAQNASQLQATLEKLRTALGSSGEIRTAGYSITPNYQYPHEGAPTIGGYTATNTVEVTTSDLAGIGKLIDTVAQAGANRIQGIQFTVKDEGPARAQALRQAVEQARANAEAMAAAMGMKAGRVLLLEQGSPAQVRPVFRAVAATAAAPTPVEPGNVEVHASVTLTMELQ